MIWLLPRSDPGAATESLRPDGCGVSTHQGRLPYGRLARVLLLWMCAELERTRQPRLDLVYALSDHLYELDLLEAPGLAEQAHRLLACRFHVRGRVMPVTEAAMTQWVENDDPFAKVIPLRATQVELAEALRAAMRRWPATGWMHSYPALECSPFELDVCLWDALDGAPGPHAKGVLPRVGRYLALAERPVPRPSSARSRTLSNWPACASHSSGKEGPAQARLEGAIEGLGTLKRRARQRTLTARRVADPQAGVVGRFVPRFTLRRRSHSARPSGVLAAGTSRHVVGR